MTEAERLVIDSQRCSETSFLVVMTQSFCLLKTGSTVNIFFIGKDVDRFPCFFWGFYKRMLLSRRFWTIAALNRGFLERLWLFLPVFLTNLDTERTDLFSFRASLVAFRHESFSTTFFKTSWLMTWGLPGRLRYSRDSEAIILYSTRWTVILLALNCFETSVFLKPASRKVDISIFLVLIRRWRLVSFINIRYICNTVKTIQMC